MYNKLDENIMKKVQKPKLITTKTKTFTIEQLELLFDYLKEYIIYTPVLLTLIFALRKSEPLMMKWSDYDRKAKKISIYSTKVNRVKRLTVPESVMLYLDLWKKEQYDLRKKYKKKAVYNDYICTLENGDCMNKQYFADCFKRVCNDLGFEGVTLQSLRTTMATIMIENDISIFLVSKWLDHTTVRTTEQYYINTIKNYSGNASKKIDDIFSHLLTHI